MCKCGGHRVFWVGYSPRALRSQWPVKDVERCEDCGKAWYYARTGRRMTIRNYLTFILHAG